MINNPLSNTNNSKDSPKDKRKLKVRSVDAGKENIRHMQKISIQKINLVKRPNHSNQSVIVDKRQIKIPLKSIINIQKQGKENKSFV